MFFSVVCFFCKYSILLTNDRLFVVNKTEIGKEKAEGKDGMKNPRRFWRG